jgi:hypothetical protein
MPVLYKSDPFLGSLPNCRINKNNSVAKIRKCAIL